MQQGSGTTARADGANGTAAGAYPSDEEILGIGATNAAGPAGAAEGDAGKEGAASAHSVEPAESPVPRNESSGDERAADAVRSTADGGRDALRDARVAPEWMRSLLKDAKVGPELQRIWEAHEAYREAFPTVEQARALKELIPGGLEEAKALVSRVDGVDAVDAAYYSGNPAAQAQLAASLLAENPRAYVSMLREGLRVLAERDPASLQALSANVRASAAQPADAPVADRATLDRAELNRQQHEFRAAQFVAFQQAANDAVVAEVRRAVDETLAGVLPEDVAEGARKRIAEDIFNEVHTTLQGDRAFGRQVATLLRQWNFDDATRRQVVELVFRRAKGLLPGVAKRVVSDWTTSVLASSRAKAARHDAAARRVDIVGGGAPEATGKRALSPREIDYSRTSDEAILEM